MSTTSVPVYLVVGCRKSQLVLAGTDGKVGDGTDVTLNAERLRREKKRSSG